MLGARTPSALLAARHTARLHQYLKGEGKRRGGETRGDLKGLNDRTGLEADGRLPRPPGARARRPPRRGSTESRPSGTHPPAAAAAALTGRRLRFRVAWGAGEVPPRPPRPRGRRPSLGGRREAAPAMGDIHEVPRRRIATGQLAQHIGQPVCFVGRVEKVWSGDGAVPALCVRGLALALRQLRAGKSWLRPPGCGASRSLWSAPA